MSENRIAVLSILAENGESHEQINKLLSDCGEYIVGRMGIPYRKKNISIISVVLDAPNEIINALTGKLGMLPGVCAKTLYSKS